MASRIRRWSRVIPQLQLAVRELRGFPSLQTKLMKYFEDEMKEEARERSNIYEEMKVDNQKLELRIWQLREQVTRLDCLAGARGQAIDSCFQACLSEGQGGVEPASGVLVSSFGDSLREQQVPGWHRDAARLGQEPVRAEVRDRPRVQAGRDAARLGRKTSLG